VSNPRIRPFSLERAAQEAAEWVICCERGLSAAEQDEYSQWLAADSRHGEQVARHRGHWDRLAPFAEWRPEHSVRPNPDLLARPPRRRWLGPVTTFAAAAGLAVLLTLHPTPSLPEAVSGPPATVVREPTATRRVLDDGTVVELNRGATLAIDFSVAERRVRLERGEAHFTVTKNPARPFIVLARGMEVQAVGTAFNVRVDTAAVEVLVTEGRVRLNETTLASTPVAAARGPLGPLLEAGQRAVVSREFSAAPPQIATLTSGEIERVLAWQHHMLEFTSAPLAEVVVEFNRRNRVQVVVLDSELSAVRVSASFRSDNIDGFVRLAELGFGLRAERRSETEIVLRRAR